MIKSIEVGRFFFGQLDETWMPIPIDFVLHAGFRTRPMFPVRNIAASKTFGGRFGICDLKPKAFACWMKRKNITALVQTVAPMPLLDCPEENAVALGGDKPSWIAARKFPACTPHKNISVFTDPVWVAFNEARHRLWTLQRAARLA